MCPGGTSGRGFHQTRSRTAHASEPEQNSKNPLQHIDKLSIARIKQASPLVQMQWKRGASEPCKKAESGSQTTHSNALQDFQRLHPWFRSQSVLEHRRMQMHSGGASDRGLHQTRSRTAQASEPQQNPKNSLQFTETLPITRFQQASPLVQMQWKRGASEPCRKAESGSQPTHSKRITRLSATAPVVQMQQ